VHARAIEKRLLENEEEEIGKVTKSKKQFEAEDF
jgi:hypothetical protein